MRNIIAIAMRDVRSNFVTPIAYVVMAGFLLLSGFFFFTLLQEFNPATEQLSLLREVTPNLNEWVVTPYFHVLEVVLIFLVPLLTMRSVSEEKHIGTFEMLATSPVKVSEIVLGKALGVAIVITVMLALSFIFPLVLVCFTTIEVAPVFVGILGLLLFAWSFAALGLAISSFTKTQTVAGVISLVFLLVLYSADAPSQQFSGKTAAFFKYLAPANHTGMLLKGVITGSDIVYFLSLILFGLFLANRVLDAQRWR